MLYEAAAYKKDWQKAQRARLKDECDEDSFVYLHLNADDDLPHHVGMGYKFGRPWEMNRTSKHKNKVAKHGVRVEIIADELTLENALWWEVRWIKALKSVGYQLTNLTEGGEGTRGFHFSEETIEKLRLRSRGENNPNYGVVTSEEKREKISKSLTGKKQGPNSEETKARKKIAAIKREEKLGQEKRSKKAIDRWASKTADERTEINKRGWETRRRNKLIKQGLL